jgi:hypothetical protein
MARNYPLNLKIKKRQNTVINPHARLDKPRGLQEAESPSISMQSPHEGVKAVSPEHGPVYPTEDTPGTHFC